MSNSNHTTSTTAIIDENGLSITKFSPKPKMLRMSDVEPQSVAWLWPDRIPLGRITLLAGMPGQGKSFLTTDLAARITTGRQMPDGSESEAGSVLMIACEDDPADTIRPRLDAANADASKVHLLSGVEYIDKDGSSETMFNLMHVDILEQALNGIPDCKLVIIDPIGSYLGSGTKANSDNDVRAVLAPIAELARESGAAVLIVAHTRKAEATFADDAVMGSRAFTGIARAVWHLMPDPDDENRRLLLQGKCNIAARSDGLSFEIQGRPATVRWDAEPYKKTANEVMVELYDRRKRKSPNSDVAEEWLSEQLKDSPVAPNDIFKAGKDAGMSEKSIRSAAKELEVVKGPTGFGLPWSWSLPVLAETVSVGQDYPDTAKTDKTAKTDNTGKNPKKNDENDHPESSVSTVSSVLAGFQNTGNTGVETAKTGEIEVLF